MTPLRSRRRMLENPERALKGYSLLPAESESMAARVEKVLLQATHLAAFGLRRLSGKLWARNLERKASDHLYGYPRHRLFLKKRGLLEAYINECRMLKVAPDSLHTAKAFFYSRLLEDLLPQQAQVLDIGGGSGVLSVFLMGDEEKRITPIIIDHQEQISAAVRTIRHYRPHRSFGVISPGHTSSLRDNEFDATLCLAAFPTMSADEVAGYLSLAQRVTRHGGYIVTVSARKQAHGWDNNPLLYPYCKDNEVVRWETEPFHFEVLRMDWQDPFILRVERVIKHAQVVQSLNKES